MGTTRVVLVRHGESEWNAAGIFQGQRGPGLTPLGHRQAAATARTVARHHADAALIARSDLVRVAQTAAPAEELLPVPVVVDERLREIDVGAWSGRTAAEVQAADPEGFAAWARGEDIPRGGGETFAQLRTRVGEVLDELVDKVGDGTAIVYTHGGVVRAAVAHALGLPGLSVAGVAPVANCAISELAWTGGAAQLVAYHRIDHLAAGTSAGSAGRE